MTITQDRIDHELRLAVSNELAWTPEVHADHIGVAVVDGVVTLSGHVPSYPEKRAALDAAGRIRGVAALADEIVVHTKYSGRDDLDIAKEAARALDRLVTVPPDSVKVTVQDHIVVLSGRVPWHFQRVAAVRAVEGLAGVRGLTDNISVAPSMPVISPIEARRKITDAFVRNSRIDAEKIRVAVTGDHIVLSGTVSSWAERRAAENTAWATPGVTQVTNQLGVDTRVR